MSRIGDYLKEILSNECYIPFVNYTDAGNGVVLDLKSLRVDCTSYVVIHDKRYVVTVMNWNTLCCKTLTCAKLTDVATTICSLIGFTDNNNQLV